MGCQQCKSAAEDFLRKYKGKGKSPEPASDADDVSAAEPAKADTEGLAENRVEPASASLAPEENKVAQRKNEEAASTAIQSAAPQKRKKTGAITKETITKLLNRAKASPEQRDFFNAFLDSVMDSQSGTSYGAKKTLVVSSNLQCIELRVQSDAKKMVELCDKFLYRCGVPTEQNFRFSKIDQDGEEKKYHSQVKHLLDLQQELESVQATLWCRVKRMGEGAGPPGIDAGFISHPTEDKIEWLLADLLMPSTGDQEALRRYAEEEHFKPAEYWCSILPREPEQALSFNISMTESPKTELLRAFFFFKCLGFEKPEDAVVRLLNNCGPKQCRVLVCMGPQGLTRVALRVWHSVWIQDDKKDGAEKKTLADALYQGLKFDPSECKAQEICDDVGFDANSVVYAAESTGYTVSVVFESDPSLRGTN